MFISNNAHNTYWISNENFIVSIYAGCEFCLTGCFGIGKKRLNPQAKWQITFLDSRQVKNVYTHTRGKCSHLYTILLTITTATTTSLRCPFHHFRFTGKKTLEFSHANQLKSEVDSLICSAAIFRRVTAFYLSEICDLCFVSNLLSHNINWCVNSKGCQQIWLLVCWEEIETRLAGDSIYFGIGMLAWNWWIQLF